MEVHTVPPEDPRLERCGFCKLYGPELEFYSKRYDIQIGRRSKSTKLDVVLGDSMNISRNHSSIQYNFDKGVWEMAVTGKNGVTVQGTLYTPVEGQPATGIPLHSQDYIQIGDKAFYFLLPRSQARRAGSPRCAVTAPPALELALTTRTNGAAEPQSYAQPGAPSVRPADAPPRAPAPAAPAAAAAAAVSAPPGMADAANGQLEAEAEDDMGPDDYDEY